jgi:hypothetical protein
LVGTVRGSVAAKAPVEQRARAIATKRRIFTILFNLSLAPKAARKSVK